MKEQINISVILPVYQLDDTTKQLLKNALKSIEEQLILPDEIVLVVPKDSNDSEYIKTSDFGVLTDIITIVENDGDTDFCSQFNLGVSKAKSEWVTLLEQDDEYAKIWFKNVVEYRDAYPDVNIFLPIIVDVDSNIDGMVIKKSLFNDFGGFKSSIKLTFIYEFLLRMTFKDAKIMSIPRFGYKHINQRPGSLFSEYKKTLDSTETRWWLSIAKKEYYFPKDRKITYDVKNG